jgi:hypothetical protein
VTDAIPDGARKDRRRGFFQDRDGRQAATEDALRQDSARYHLCSMSDRIDYRSWHRLTTGLRVHRYRGGSRQSRHGANVFAAIVSLSGSCLLFCTSDRELAPSLAIFLSENPGAKCRLSGIRVLTFPIRENSEATEVMQQFVMIQQVGGVFRMADSLLID